MQSTVTFKVQPSLSLQGEIRVPSDKSISHRAILFGAIAEGHTRIQNCLLAEDCLAMLQAFQNMGVDITYNQQGEVNIGGVGLYGLQAPSKNLDLGNSGTAIRLLAGLLAGQKFNSTLTGDASLRRRPMGRVIKPLQQMGAHISANDAEYPPIHIEGGQILQGIHYVLPMASAQVKSCLLLAGMYAEGETTVQEPAITRDHTERMLQAFAYPVQQTKLGISIVGKQTLHATDINVPADLSSAAFFLVGASIAKNSVVRLKQVGINPTRMGVIAILRAMGADIEIKASPPLKKGAGSRSETGDFQNISEPTADIIVRYAPLKGVEIPIETVSLAIDEFPALFIAAACASGTTVLRGAKELRVKESDRLGVMAAGLKNLGIKVLETSDGLIIEGGQISGGVIDSHGDHRIAMAFSIAALAARQEIVIQDCANVATSFPNFVQAAQHLGLQISASVE